MEMLLPNLPIPKTDRELPRRENRVMLTEDPRRDSSLTERKEPNRALPYTETLDPSLKKLRRLIFEPKSA
jgi:hypothetical protein